MITRCDNKSHRVIIYTSRIHRNSFFSITVNGGKAYFKLVTIYSFTTIHTHTQCTTRTEETDYGCIQLFSGPLIDIVTLWEEQKITYTVYRVEVSDFVLF